MTRHAILALEAKLDAAQLATDKICVACGEDNPEYCDVIHGIPVKVCGPLCRVKLIYYWRA